MREISNLISLMVIGGAFTILLGSLLGVRLQWRYEKVLSNILFTATQVLRWVGILAILNGLFIFIAYPENSAFLNRATGPYAWAYWMMFLGLTVLPQLYWIGVLQKAPWRWMIALGLLCTSGGFFEEIVIIVTSFHRDFKGSESLWAFALKNVIRIATFSGVTLVVMDIKKRIQQPQTYYND